MRVDRLLKRRGPAVVEEALGVAEVDEWLSAELRRGREAEADVRQIRPHVMQQQVGVRGELPVPQRGDGAVARA